MRDYYSFELTLRGGFVILIPHKLLVYESFRQKEKIFYDIDRINTIPELLFFLERSCRDDNFKLNKTDLEIIKNITSKRFIGELGRFPTFSDLSIFFKRHRNTVASRMKKLIDSYILSIIYKVNPTVLDYETYFLLSETSNIYKEFDAYNLAKIPVSGAIHHPDGYKEYQIHLTQIPISRKGINIYNRIKNNSNTLIFQELNKEYLGWNLSTLTSEVKGRWNTLPPILSTYQWDDEIQSMENGIEINLQPKYEEKIHLTPVDRKILDLYANHNLIENIEISKRTKVSERYIRESKSRLLTNKIIHIFAHVSNIGLTFIPWITIIFENKEHHRRIMNNIIEHLKFFPFVRIFYNLTKPVLTGYIFMNESWVSDFLYKFYQLRDFGLKVDINYSYNRIVKWSINITYTLS